MPVHLTTATVPISGTVSGAVGLANVRAFALWAPALTSADVRFLASYDTTSANYVPVHEVTSGAPRKTLALGAGSKMVVVTDVLYTSVKIDLSAPQAAARTFEIITKP